MLKTLQAQLLSNPQATEFHVEHPETPASPDDRRQDHTGDFLIVSPYTSFPHLLDLKTVTIPQQLLARALTSLEPIRADYATAPYIDSFNWATVFANLKELVQETNYTWKRQHFYVITFRSQIPPTTDRVELGELDERSHAEATKSGGLLKYWFGTPDRSGRNLANCIWRQQSDARPASAGPGHKAAQRATISMYTEWRIERLRLEVGDQVNEWSIAPWKDGVDH